MVFPNNHLSSNEPVSYTHLSLIVSDEGYGKNDYIETTRPLVVITAPGPGSGKMATCLSQLYHEYKRGISAGSVSYTHLDVYKRQGLKYLDNFGFTTLAHGTEADTDANGNVYTDANLPTALGGLTYGVKNVELCAAYAAIANGGNYIKPVYYTKILDHNGNVLIENNSVGRSVIKETTCLLYTSYGCSGHYVFQRRI